MHHTVSSGLSKASSAIIQETAARTYRLSIGDDDRERVITTGCTGHV